MVTVVQNIWISCSSLLAVKSCIKFFPKIRDIHSTNSTKIWTFHSSVPGGKAKTPMFCSLW